MNQTSTSFQPSTPTLKGHYNGHVNGQTPLEQRLDNMVSRIENLEGLLYDLDVLVPMEMAARLIPCTYMHLRQWLSRHKEDFKPRYMYNYATKRRYRYLLGREVRAIRKTHYKGPGVVDL